MTWKPFEKINEHLNKMKNLKSLSLKTKVIAAVLASFVLAAILLISFAKKNIREDILSLSAKQQVSTANVAAAQLNHEFYDRLTALAVATQFFTRAMLNQPPLIQAEISRHPVLETLFNEGLYIVKADGTIISDQAREIKPFIDQASIKAVLSGQAKSIVGTPSLDQYHQAPLFLMVNAISDEQGQVIAALVGATNLAKINFIDKVTSNQYGENGEFLIVDHQHRLIVSATDKNRVMEQLPPLDKIALIDEYLASHSSSSVGLNSKGVEVLESSKLIPLAGWQFIVTLPTAEIFAPIRALNNARTMLCALIAIMLMIILSRWSLKKLFIPMTEAAQTLATWSKNPENFTQQHLKVHHHDEIGTLIKAFNQLLAINGAREAMLSASKEEYKKLAIVAQTTTNSVSITDCYGHVLWVNPAFIAFTGYSAAFMLGKKLGSFLQGAETNPDTVKIMHGAIKHHKGFNVEVVNYKKSGEKYWTHIIATPIDEDNKNSGYVSIQSDITSQKQVLASTEREHEDKEALFDSNPNPMLAISPERQVSYVNPAFCQLFKVKAKQILSIHEIELDNFIKEKCIHTDNYIATSNLAIKSDIKVGKTIASKDHALGFNLELTDGKVIARHYIDCNIPRISRIIYYNDITERILIDKMKSEFVATAAHELRTPMTMIYGYTELLKMGAGNADEKHEMLEVIYNQSNAMINLLNDMLDVARIEAQAVGLLQMKTQQIGPSLVTLAETFITSDNHNKINLHLAQNLPEVKVDIAKIEQAVKNCLSNAYKFSPKHGPIDMHVAEVMHDGQRKLLIAIEDYGIGMTPEQLARVFEKFYRANPAGAIPGTGLGMAIIKNIMDQHGGSVEIESKYKLGTKVMLYLPVADSISIDAVIKNT